MGPIGTSGNLGFESDYEFLRGLFSSFTLFFATALGGTAPTVVQLQAKANPKSQSQANLSAKRIFPKAKISLYSLSES